MEGVIGVITMFGGNFAPRTTALCDGQLLSISSNSALFSILGTTYGGDGRSTFGLPDLRGRSAVHAGSGPGLTTRRLGNKSGTETNVISATQLPAHTHTATATTVMNVDTKGAAVKGNPNDAFLAKSGTATMYDDGPANATMNAAALTTTVTVGNAGASASLNNMHPYQCVNFVIFLTGLYPSRN